LSEENNHEGIDYVVRIVGHGACCTCIQLWCAAGVPKQINGEAYPKKKIITTTAATGVCAS
jgi:hypothetical protein